MGETVVDTGGVSDVTRQRANSWQCELSSCNTRSLVKPLYLFGLASDLASKILSWICSSQALGIVRPSRAHAHAPDPRTTKSMQSTVAFPAPATDSSRTVSAKSFSRSPHAEHNKANHCLFFSDQLALPAQAIMQGL